MELCSGCRAARKARAAQRRPTLGAHQPHQRADDAVKLVIQTLRSFPSRLPGRTATQDSLPAGGQPLPHGLAPAWVPGEVSASSTSLPPHPGFAWRTGLPIPSPISPWAIRIKAPCSSRRWGPLLVRSQDRSDSSRTMNATWGGVFYARSMRSAANCGTPLLSASKSFGSEV